MADPNVGTKSVAVRAVLLLMLVVGFGHFNRISMSVAGTGALIPDAGISETEMGVVYSGFLLCYTLAMLPGGWFIDRFGAKAALAVLCGGSAVFVAITGLTAWVGSTPALLWAALLTVRCLMGVVNAPLHPASAQLIGQTVPPPLLSLSNGLVTFAACVGMASTYFVFGAVMDRFGWPAAFLGCSGLTVCVFLVWLALAPRPRDVAPSASIAPHGILTLVANRSLLLLTLSYAALGYFQYLLFYWVEYYFKDVIHLAPDRSRVYSALVVLANGVGMILGGWLADIATRWPHRNAIAVVPAAGLVGSGIFLAAGLASSAHELTLACFIAAMVAVGMCEGPCWTIAVALGGTRGGTAAALMNTGGNAGGFLAPVVTPLLSRYFGWQMSMGVASLVVLLGALLWFGIDTRPKADCLPADPS